MTNGELTLQQRKQLTARAKSRIVSLWDAAGYPKSLRNQLLLDLEKMFHEISLRNEWLETMTICLAKSEEISFSIRETRYQAFTCNKHLAVTTVTPGWGFGWRQQFTEPDIYDLSLTFFTPPDNTYTDHKSQKSL